MELTDNDKREEVLTSYDRAGDLNRMFHEASFSRGYVFYLQGKFDLAINDFPDHGDYRYESGINKIRSVFQANIACQAFKKASDPGYKLAAVDITNHGKDYQDKTASNNDGSRPCSLAV